MIEVRCPDCNKLLFKADGSYQISCNCSRCKKIFLLKSAKPTLEQIQHDFSNQLAQTGMRANNPR